jgi:hypothetical protein
MYPDPLRDPRPATMRIGSTALCSLPTHTVTSRTFGQRPPRWWIVRETFGIRLDQEMINKAMDATINRPQLFGFPPWLGAMTRAANPVLTRRCALRGNQADEHVVYGWFYPTH